MLLLRFGLPIGSALVIVASINAVYIGLAIIPVIEDLIFDPQFSLADHLVLLISLIISTFLTLVLWIGVIFGKSVKLLYLWIILTLVSVTVNTALDLIRAVNNIPSKSFDWRDARNLLVIFTLEALFLLIAVQAVKALSIENRYLMTNNNDSGEWLRNQESYSPYLKPIGMSPKKFLEFYKKRVVLTARAFLTFDTLLSITEILTKNHPVDLYEPQYYGIVPEWTNSLALAEDGIIRSMRVGLSIIILYLIAKKKSVTYVKGCAFGLLLLIIFSSVIFILQFFSTKSDVASYQQGRFYVLQAKFFCDIIFRFVVLHFLYNCIENAGYLPSAFSDDFYLLQQEVELQQVGMISSDLPTSQMETR